MALTVTSVGDNAFQPGIVAETFIPDQLIAGGLKLVTDSVTITGGAKLARGTVLGRVNAGSNTSSTGKTYASGTIVVAALPTAADTLTVQGTVITFVNFPADSAGGTVGPFVDVVAQGNNVFIQATTAAMATALASFLANSTDANISKMTYSLSGTTITATAVVIGTGGNAYTLATSDVTAFTLSGATLSGGTANTGTATIGTISAGPLVKPGIYSIVLTSSTQGFVNDPNGAVLGQMTMGTAFKSPEINFTITTGGSPAAGDAFNVSFAPGSGSYKLAVATNTDGSEVPAAILVDTTDASAGDVTGGVYLMGEFNALAVTLDPSYTLAAAKAALIPIGIFLKTAVVSAGDPVGE